MTTLGLLIAEPQLAVERWRRVLDLVVAGEQEVVFEEVVVEGLPTGSPEAVLEGFAELDASAAVGVLGPANGDNCIQIQPRADAARLPTVGLCATIRWPSEWCFSVPWGSCPEDALLVARWLGANGHKRIAVITDTLWHSAEYLEYFRIGAQRLGFEIIAVEQLPAGVRTAAEAPEEQLRRAHDAVGRLRVLAPDALAHLGPLSLTAVASAVAATGWDIPRVANNAFAAAQHPDRIHLFEGWVGTSCWHDDNELMAQLLDEHLAAHGVPAHPDFAAAVHDGARVLLEGLALAPAPDRAGLRAGLERVRQLPSALGGPDSVLSFGPWDHRALKSRDMMVLRRVDGGRSVMERLP